MTEYLGFLVAASAVISFGSLLARDGGEAGGIKLAMGIMLLSVSVLPIASVVVDTVSAGGEIFSDVEFPNTENSEYQKTAEQAFCDGIKKLVKEEFTVAENELDVAVFGFDVTKMRAEKIKIILSGSAVHSDFRSLRARIEELGLGECEVELDVG